MLSLSLTTPLPRVGFKATKQNSKHTPVLTNILRLSVSSGRANIDVAVDALYKKTMDMNQCYLKSRMF